MSIPVFICVRQENFQFSKGFKVVSLSRAHPWGQELPEVEELWRGICTGFSTRSRILLCASQAAAEAVDREHPDGIDFLIVNAAVADAEHKTGIESCALRCWLRTRTWPGRPGSECTHLAQCDVHSGVRFAEPLCLLCCLKYVKAVALHRFALPLCACMLVCSLLSAFGA